MSATRFLRVNTPRVVGEVVDDELMAINLESGVYYSVIETGVEVWRWIEHGHDLAECVEHLAATHDIEANTVDDAVRAFAAELVTEGLVTAVDSPAPSPSPSTDPPSDGVSTAVAAFTAPKLERFVDLEKLIQLDPVLDIDADGWPLPAEQA